MISAIIVAGGKGERLGSDIPKQFLKLDNNKMIIEMTIEKFEENNNIREIIVVAPTAHLIFLEDICKKYKKVKKIVEGGKTRQSSVYNGLENITCDYVFVHDGVRPFISTEEINDLARLVQTKNCIINSTKVKDTIKISENDTIIDTPKRDMLYAASTPQCFKSDILKKAHSLAILNDYIGTDEADIVEQIGEKVFLYHGNYDNIKITTKLDLIIGNALLNKEK